MSVFNSYYDMLCEYPESSIPEFTDYQDVNTPDQFDDYLLTAACSLLQVENVKYFISRGADLEVRNVDQNTPLLCAIDVCNHNPSATCKIIEILLDAGADIEARGWMNKTPFLKACTRGCVDVLKLLVSRGCDIYAEVEDVDVKATGMYYADVFHTDREFQTYLKGLYVKDA